MKYVFYVTTILCVAPFILSGLINIFHQYKSKMALREVGINYISPILLAAIKMAGVGLILLPSFELLNLSGYIILLTLAGYKFYCNRKYAVTFLNYFIVILILLLLSSALLLSKLNGCNHSV
jgi:hypothetical protein